MRSQNFPIALEGAPFFGFTFLIGVFFLLLGVAYVSIIFFSLTLFTLWFFRNPKRDIPLDNGVIAPADGKVVAIQKIYDERYLKKDSMLISIFMSVFNVHINRVPFPGTVLRTEYNKGKFFSANKNKASLENEQNAIIIDIGGEEIAVNQIAGLLARRIVCYVKEKDLLEKGQRFGLIRFGSRVDIYLPQDFNLKIKLGDKVKGGETILGYLDNNKDSSH